MSHDESRLGRLVTPEDMQLTEHEQLSQICINGRGILPATYSRVFHLDDDVAWSLELWTRSFLEFGLVGTMEDDGLHCAHLDLYWNAMDWNERRGLHWWSILNPTGFYGPI